MTDKVLVTGGCGFLGSHLCESLLADGHDVISVDNLSSGRLKNVEHLLDHPNFTLSERDIRLPQPFPKVDAIFHMASMASPADFTKHPVRIALANTQGTKRLLDHALACNAKMVFASTSEIYGDPEVHPQPESYNGNVDIRGPRGCYGESKRFGETLIAAYNRKYDLDVRTARIFNTYGPRMRPDDGRVIPTFVSQALSGEDLTVFGDGKQTRSFCYVPDLIEGLRRLLSTDTLSNDVYNLGAENERTINDLAEVVVDVCDSASGIVHESLPEDDPSRRRPDISRARNELDWEPEFSLHDGLMKTIEYFEEELEMVAEAEK